MTDKLWYCMGFTIPVGETIATSSTSFTTTVKQNASHVDMSTSDDEWVATYVEFAAWLHTQMAADAGFSVTLQASGVYVITYTGTLDLTGAPTIAALLGLNATTYTPSPTTATAIPNRLIIAAEPGRSFGTKPLWMRPTDRTQGVVSDDGKPYGVSRDTEEKLSVWTQPMEPYEACFGESALVTAPWAWSDFFDVRMDAPFVLAGEIGDGLATATLGVYMLDPASDFTPVLVSADWLNYLNVPISAHYLGRVTA